MVDCTLADPERRLKGSRWALQARIYNSSVSTRLRADCASRNLIALLKVQQTVNLLASLRLGSCRNVILRYSLFPLTVTAPPWPQGGTPRSNLCALLSLIHGSAMLQREHRCICAAEAGGGHSCIVMVLCLNTMAKCGSGPVLSQVPAACLWLGEGFIWAQPVPTAITIVALIVGGGSAITFYL